MHLLTTTSANLDDIVEAVDLGQPPGDIAVLSFADSDLAGLAAAWEAERDGLPSVRLAHLRELRHPMSVDLWIDRVGAHAKVIWSVCLAVSIGGNTASSGCPRWRASAASRSRCCPAKIATTPRLAAASTLPPAELDALLRYFREGGRENLRALLRRLGASCRMRSETSPLRARCRGSAGYQPGEGAVELERLLDGLELCPSARTRAVIPIIFYRAMLLAADTAPIDALCAALAARGLAPAPLVVTSLKDEDAAAFLRDAFARLDPALIVTTTAFAAGAMPAAKARSTGQSRRSCKSSAQRPGAPRGVTVAARPWRRRSGNACGAARARRPHSRRRCRLQGSAAAAGRARLHRAGEPPRAGSRRHGRRPHCGARAPARAAARRTLRCDADAGLSRRAGTHRLCGRARCARQRASPLLDDLAAAGYAVGDAPKSARALLDALAGGEAAADA